MAMRMQQTQTNSSLGSNHRASSSSVSILPRQGVITQTAVQQPLIEPTFGRGFKHDFSHVPASRSARVLSDNDAGPDAGADAGTPDRMDAGPDAGTGAGTKKPSFPTYAQIVGDSDAVKAMDAAWTSTKSATTRTSRREQGFWIKQNVGTGKLEFTPTFTGPSVGPGETGAADPGTKPADTDAGTDKAVYTVGLFHTHTPMTYRTGGTRDVGPSGPDNRFHTSNKVVGIVYDYVESPAGSGSIPAGHPLDSAAKLYHSGPNQRT